MEIVRNPFPMGFVEPHAHALRQPPESQLLYKIMSAQNFVRSVSGDYLHFQRADTYGDDKSDSEQLPLDRPFNEGPRFEKSPEYSAERYYDESRSRSYACCFSLENSPYIWENYGNGDANGKICIVFNFDKLRKYLNGVIESSINNGTLLVGEIWCKQIFSINYGIVEYVDRESHRNNETVLPNPISYLFLKDKRYQDEKELRISLTAIGIGRFESDPGIPLIFPAGLSLQLEFKKAIDAGIIVGIIVSPDANRAYIGEALEKIRVRMKIDEGE